MKAMIFTLTLALLGIGVLFCGTMPEENHNASEKSTSENSKFSTAMKFHNEGVDGSKSAVKKSIKYFEELVTENPDNAKYIAYLGSSYNLRARDAFFPWSKLKYVEQGSDNLDKAVKMAPNSTEIRMIRAMNNIYLPKFLNRTPICIDDFTSIIKNREFNYWKAEQQQEVYYHLALAYEKIEENDLAKDNYSKCRNLNPETKLGKAANSKLEK
jgi:tetratricopeptide (TPR) repeat protein